MPAEVEELLLAEPAQTPEQRERLLQYYLSVAPELAAERRAIEALRKQMPGAPTTLVMRERPAGTIRGRPSFTIAANSFSRRSGSSRACCRSCRRCRRTRRANRLTFARWLVDGDNPLTAA